MGQNPVVVRNIDIVELVSGDEHPPPRRIISRSVVLSRVLPQPGAGTVV